MIIILKKGKNPYNVWGKFDSNNLNYCIIFVQRLSVKICYVFDCLQNT